MYSFYSKSATEVEMVLREHPVPNQWSWGMRQSQTWNLNPEFSAVDADASSQRWAEGM